MKYKVTNAPRWSEFKIGQVVDLKENQVAKTLAPWGSEVMALAANPEVVVEAHTAGDTLTAFIEYCTAFCSAYTTAVVYIPGSGDVYTGNPAAFIGKSGKRVKECGVKIRTVKHLRELHGDPIWETAKAYPRFEKYWGKKYSISIPSALGLSLEGAIMIGCGLKQKP